MPPRFVLLTLDLPLEVLLETEIYSLYLPGTSEGSAAAPAATAPLSGATGETSVGALFAYDKNLECVSLGVRSLVRFRSKGSQL